MPSNEKGYSEWHWHVRCQRGHAPEHLCVSCGKQAEHWALKPEHINPEVTRQYVENLDAYQPMCAKCHKKQDSALYGKATRARMSVSQTGRIHSAETRAKLSAAMSLRDPSTINTSGLDAYRGTPHKPESIEKMSTSHKRRVTCDECGLESNLNGVHRHQRKSGHAGWKRIN